VSGPFASAGQASGIADSSRRLGMSALAVWVAYFAVGGNGSLADVTGWVFGTTSIPVHDYDLLAQAMNDEFVALGADHPVPYIRG
jgi:hypothetical protein